MNEYCECEKAGYCNRHQMKKGKGQFERCKGIANTRDCGLKYWNKWEQGELGSVAPENPQINPEGFCDKQQLLQQTQQVKSGPGTELIKIYQEAGVPSCSQCNDLATLMDEWGADKCEENIAFLIDDILPRAKNWIANNKPWVHRLLPNTVEEIGIRIKVRGDIKEAIERSRKQNTPVQLKTPVKKTGGCGCG